MTQEILSNTAEHQPLSPSLKKFYTANGFQEQIFRRGRQQHILASRGREVQNSGYFIRRDENKAPTDLILQHWDFCCRCTAGEGASGGVRGARVRTMSGICLNGGERKKGCLGIRAVSLNTLGQTGCAWHWLFCHYLANKQGGIFSKQFHCPILYILSLNAFTDWIAGASPEMDIVYQSGWTLNSYLLKLFEK